MGEPGGNGRYQRRVAWDEEPFRYRGYVYDDETGFYYVSSRYYDPEIGRWINADTTDVLSLPYYHPEQYNLFTYCNNNPVNDRDGGGQLSWLARIAIGAAAIAIGVGVTALTGGAALPALAAGVKAACVTGAISAGISATTTAVSSAISGDRISSVVRKSAKVAVDGFADGFMAGGIAALDRFNKFRMTDYDVTSVFQHVMDRKSVLACGLHANIFAIIFGKPIPQFAKTACVGGKPAGLILCNALCVCGCDTCDQKIPVNVHTVADRIHNF